MASYIPHNTVRVYLYNSAEPLQFYNLNGLTAEKLCYIVAAKIKYHTCVLSNRDITSFQLATKDDVSWLSPSRKIEGKMDLWFRLRYQFNRDKDCTGLGIAAMEYYYHQCRADFLQGRSWDIFEDQEVMGLTVMDMMRYALENDINKNIIMKKVNYKNYLPYPLPARLDWVFKKKTLKKRIKEGLCEFAQSSWQVADLKRTYIAHFEKKHDNLGMEIFQNGTQKIKVSGDNGVEITDGKLVRTFDFCDITDVMAVHTRLNGKIDVTINLRKGQPIRSCEMESEQAESLISLLDGYYRLLVDYYHFLCDEYKSPMLGNLLEARCHGPIS
uniref:Tyrosine-protein kinase JAK2-like n=1 Tax=Saccoglossus kowalevskii TaxID=10224 RepID=A0ABM0MCG7_SACKO|nr:PREDICTED: tyrosine-protein kinase JAK2-like [Saccoglossus kowalevskii]